MIDGTERPIQSLQTRSVIQRIILAINSIKGVLSLLQTLTLSFYLIRSVRRKTIKVQEKKEKVVVLCFHPPQKGTFMS